MLFKFLQTQLRLSSKKVPPMKCDGTEVDKHSNSAMTVSRDRYGG